MRILTRTQYEAICDIVTDLQKENDELKAKLDKKNETIDYLNEKLFERNREVSRLRTKLNENGLSFTISGVDFPIIRSENKLF